MEEKLVFVSVGGTATAEQESFVRSIEDRLRSESLIPKPVGRNTFSADAPLKAITELMDHCSGIVVIALERSFFPAGIDKRGGPRQAATNCPADVRPTPRLCWSSHAAIAPAESSMGAMTDSCRTLSVPPQHH